MAVESESLELPRPTSPDASPNGKSSPAREAAERYLAERGAGPRRYRNTLAFLAADARRLEELESAVRAARKLAQDELLLTGMAGSVLREAIQEGVNRTNWNPAPSSGSRRQSRTHGRAPECAAWPGGSEM